MTIVDMDIDKKLTENNYLFEIRLVNVYGVRTNIIHVANQLTDLYRFTDYLVRKGIFPSEIEVKILNMVDGKIKEIGEIDTELKCATVYT